MFAYYPPAKLRASIRLDTKRLNHDLDGRHEWMQSALVSFRPLACLESETWVRRATRSTPTRAQATIDGSSGDRSHRTHRSAYNIS